MIERDGSELVATELRGQLRQQAVRECLREMMDARNHDVDRALAEYKSGRLQPGVDLTKALSEAQEAWTAEDERRRLDSILAAEAKQFEVDRERAKTDHEKRIISLEESHERALREISLLDDEERREEQSDEQESAHSMAMEDAACAYADELEEIEWQEREHLDIERGRYDSSALRDSTRWMERVSLLRTHGIGGLPDRATWQTESGYSLLSNVNTASLNSLVVDGDLLVVCGCAARRGFACFSLLPYDALKREFRLSKKEVRAAALSAQSSTAKRDVVAHLVALAQRSIDS